MDIPIHEKTVFMLKWVSRAYFVYKYKLAKQALHSGDENVIISTQTWGVVIAVHDDVIKWKHFPRHGPFVRGIHRSPVNSPQKRPVTRSFDIFFDLRPNKRLSKQW